MCKVIAVFIGSSRVIYVGGFSKANFPNYKFEIAHQIGLLRLLNYSCTMIPQIHLYCIV